MSRGFLEVRQKIWICKVGLALHETMLMSSKMPMSLACLLSMFSLMMFSSILHGMLVTCKTDRPVVSGFCPCTFLENGSHPCRFPLLGGQLPRVHWFSEMNNGTANSWLHSLTPEGVFGLATSRKVIRLIVSRSMVWPWSGPGPGHLSGFSASNFPWTSSIVNSISCEVKYLYRLVLLCWVFHHRVHL